MVKFRWWLADVYVLFAHALTRKETGREPMWLQEYAMARIRVDLQRRGIAEYRSIDT